MTDVAIFLTDLQGGGAERVMLNLANGFAAQGFDVELVLVNLEGPYLAQVSDRVKVFHLGKAKLLASLPALVTYLKQKRPKVLLSALEDTNIIALWAQKISRIPMRVVLTVHNNLSEESKNSAQLKRQLVPHLIPWIYPGADSVVAVSKGVAEDLVSRGLPKEKITVIYNPLVNPNLIQKAQASVEHLWLKPGSVPVILGVGRLNRQKDFPTLIRAFALVKKQISARLMILGEGEELANLQALVDELCLSEQVCFPGFVNNPYAYMAKASVCVLSSAWEGFGNVLVEAMALGVPVVSTDCKSGPAEILENGKYGPLVGVKDIQGMAEAMMKVLKTPLRSDLLQERSREFSSEKSISEYLQVLGLK
jgi:glycosyltransferase involved in cell wall biosynthesis